MSERKPPRVSLSLLPLIFLLNHFLTSCARPVSGREDSSNPWESYLDEWGWPIYELVSPKAKRRIAGMPVTVYTVRWPKNNFPTPSELLSSLGEVLGKDFPNCSEVGVEQIEILVIGEEAGKDSDEVASVLRGKITGGNGFEVDLAGPVGVIMFNSGDVVYKREYFISEKVIKAYFEATSAHELWHLCTGRVTLDIPREELLERLQTAAGNKNWENILPEGYTYSLSGFDILIYEQGDYDSVKEKRPALEELVTTVFSLQLNFLNNPVEEMDKNLVEDLDLLYVGDVGAFLYEALDRLSEEEKREVIERVIAAEREGDFVALRDVLVELVEGAKEEGLGEEWEIPEDLQSQEFINELIKSSLSQPDMVSFREAAGKLLKKYGIRGKRNSGGIIIDAMFVEAKGGPFKGEVLLLATLQESNGKVTKKVIPLTLRN